MIDLRGTAMIYSRLGSHIILRHCESCLPSVNVPEVVRIDMYVLASRRGMSYLCTQKSEYNFSKSATGSESTQSTESFELT